MLYLYESHRSHIFERGLRILKDLEILENNKVSLPTPEKSIIFG